MPEIVASSKPKALKEHRCDFCGEKIFKGEIYNRQFLKGDGVYWWKSHLRCAEISSLLWEFIDPDEGMSGEDFTEGCQSYCQQFVCVHCKHLNGDTEECNTDLPYCVDKLFQRLKEYGAPKYVAYRWVEE